jgi:hypothetical protein
MVGTGTLSHMGRGPSQTSTHDRQSSIEDLGEDVLALAVAAEARGRASVLRQVNGILVRVIVERV